MENARGEEEAEEMEERKEYWRGLQERKKNIEKCVRERKGKKRKMDGGDENAEAGVGGGEQREEKEGEGE